MSLHRDGGLSAKEMNCSIGRDIRLQIRFLGSVDIVEGSTTESDFSYDTNLRIQIIA